MAAVGTPLYDLAVQPEDSLLGALLTLQLACGRSRRSLKKRNRQYFCYLMQVLEAELDRRGVAHVDRVTSGDDLVA